MIEIETFLLYVRSFLLLLLSHTKTLLPFSQADSRIDDDDARVTRLKRKKSFLIQSTARMRKKRIHGTGRGGRLCPRFAVQIPPHQRCSEPQTRRLAIVVLRFRRNARAVNSISTLLLASSSSSSFIHPSLARCGVMGKGREKGGGARTKKTFSAGRSFNPVPWCVTL